MEILIGSLIVATTIIFSTIAIKKRLLSKDFENLRIVLDYHCQQAYKSIYKSRILVYSVNATKLVGKELDDIKKEYCDLTLKLLGPNLTKELRKLYGNSLLLNILLYFEEKYDDDEIYSTTIDKMKEEATNGS